VAFAAIILFGGSAALFADWAGGPFHNGDEVIYAQMAREMAAGKGVLTLSWQGEPVLNRPPLAVWPLALAVKLGAQSERALHGVVAIECALAVTLLFFYAARRYGRLAGFCAACFLATSGLFFYYARYIESEPLLIVLTTGALLCWEKARERPAWMLGWGVCLGASLLVKQVVGFLPLLAPIADLLERRAIPRRAFVWSLAWAALVAVPWHVYESARYGGRFWDGFFRRTVAARPAAAQHQTTERWFYFGMLWHWEGPLVIVSALGLVYGALRRDLLPALWAAGVLAVYSLAASRYNYYALLCYPALALGSALAATAVTRLRFWLAAPLVLASIALHIVPRFGAPSSGDAEIRALAESLGKISRPDDVLLVIDENPFTARYYSGRHTIWVQLDAAHYEEASFLLPGEVVLAPDAPSLGALAARYPRWFAIAPRVDFRKLATFGTVTLDSQTPSYLLFTNQKGPG
jgi:4-amino-4-deoxy-L-arabinose transferase-like glycosyltransferase